MSLKMAIFYTFTRQFELYVLFICFNVSQIMYLECFSCEIDFTLMCEQPCPSHCKQCQSKDLCFTCTQSESLVGSRIIYICDSICGDKCFLKGTCLNDCSSFDRHQRPHIQCANETCFKCLSLSSNCSQCIKGRYGSFCEKICGHCRMNFKEGVDCNTRSGECKGECDNGYFGRRCDKECRNCLTVSHSNSCEQISGKCTNGCLPGWYYDTCNETCSKNCLQRTCHQINGHCINGCTAGYYGSRCNNNCNEKCIQRSCDQFTGKCKHGCKQGWFGETCGNACPDKCFHRWSCQSSGNCTHGCLAGWFGNTCNISCNDACLNKSCRQFTGECTHGCKQGWFGETCGSACPEKCLHRSCHLSGNCTYGCLPGWFGDTCDISCNDACLNKSCARLSGMCDFGCINGFNGVRCDKLNSVSRINSTGLDKTNSKERTTNNLDSNRILYAVGGTIAGMFATGFCCILIIVVRKAIISIKRYDYLNNSLRNNAQPIYDVITQNEGTSLVTDVNLRNVESNAVTSAITLERISHNANDTVVGDNSEYAEINLESDSSEICVEEDNVYYLHPIN